MAFLPIQIWFPSSFLPDIVLPVELVLSLPSVHIHYYLTIPSSLHVASYHHHQTELTLPIC